MTILQLKPKQTLYSQKELFLRNYSTLTDYEIGSIIRTLLEEAAESEDEVYYQINQLLESFDIYNATGDELDRVALKDSLTRNPASYSTVTVHYKNNALIQGVLLNDTTSGTASIVLDDTSPYPVPGATYTIRISEGDANEEEKTVTANTVSTNTLTLSAGLDNDHSAGDRVSYISGAGSISIAAGQTISSRSTSTKAAVQFVTTTGAVISDGNYYSNAVTARSTATGSSQRVGAGTVVDFVSTLPFAGASVSNDYASSGGNDLENDKDFRARLVRHRQSQSKGTVLALQDGLLGVTEETQGLTIRDVYIDEDFENDRVFVYIDDGSGFLPTQIVAPQDSLSLAYVIGNTAITLSDASRFPEKGHAIISPESSSEIEVGIYSAKTAIDTLTFTALSRNHTSGDSVLYAYKIAEAEEGQKNFKLPFYGIVRDSERIFIAYGGTVTDVEELSSNTDYFLSTPDYFLNHGTGELEILGDGLDTGDELYISCDYYTGLVHEAYKVLNGDTEDIVNYPGYKAAGIVTFVEPPVIRVISVEGALEFFDYGVSDNTAIIEAVELAVSAYIDSLKMGDNVILNKLRSIVMDVSDSIKDVSITDPLVNITILENEKPRSVNSAGTSVVNFI